MRNLILVALCFVFANPVAAKDWHAELKKLDAMPQSAKVKKQRAVVYNNIAVAAQRVKDWNKAEKWMKKAISEDRKGGYEKTLAIVYLTQAYDSYEKRANREYTCLLYTSDAADE